MCEICVSSPIQADRLTLLPSSLEVEMAILIGREAIEKVTRLEVAKMWPGEDWIDALHSLIDMYAEHPDWCAWNRNVVHQNHQALIGGVGCVIPPQEDGSVTVGYYIVPDYRRQGYALEAVDAYTKWLKLQPEVKSIRAQCLTDNIASILILDRIGMKRVGLFDDEEGHKIQWEIEVR